MSIAAFVVHIIDDDGAVRESLEALLVVSGFEVETYDSAEDYLARAHDGEGCIVLDVNMPGIGGLELLQILARRHRQVPVVVLTAIREPNLEERALQLGASEVLTKPVRRATLIEALHAAHIHQR
jgi:two-component system, LuxR family, response regulator FixJ